MPPIERMEAVVQLGSASRIGAVAYRPDGALVATAGEDGIIRIYRACDGRLLRVLGGHSNSVSSVHFSPDGTALASGSYDKTVRLWDTKSGKNIRVLDGHSGSIHSVHFSPDGAVLASGSEDHIVRLWDPESGACRAVLAGHLGPVLAVCYAPNGKYLVAAGWAARLQFWDIETCETFLYRYHLGPGAWLALLPDGRFDASPEGMRYLCYTEEGTFNSFTAEELVQEFHDPRAVKAAMLKIQEPSAKSKG